MGFALIVAMAFVFFPTPSASILLHLHNSSRKYRFVVSYPEVLLQTKRIDRILQ